MQNPFEGTHLSSASQWFPRAPITYSGNRILFVTFKTSGEVLRFLTPEQLEVGHDNLITIYVGALNVSHPMQFDYYEAGMLIPVSYKSIQGSYMPILYLDKVIGIILGREIWGFPKFQGDFSLETMSDTVRANVRVDGVSLIDITLQLADPVPPTGSFPPSIILLKSIPSAIGGTATDVKQLTTAVVRDSTFSEVRPGHATLRLGSTPSDPLGSIPVLEIVGSTYTTGGFVLDYGEILHDYLRPPL